MPEPAQHDDVNVRSRSYFVACTVATCSHCRGPTRMVALALPHEHEVLDPDDEAEEAEVALETWSAASHSAFLFLVAHLPETVQLRIKEFAPAYRLAHSPATLGYYWANHCERCHSLLEDHYLFCEPEGAFLPTSMASASLIHLVHIDEEIEAAAAGYAADPQFFDAMPRA
jgi:hypothetical protein